MHVHITTVSGHEVDGEIVGDNGRQLTIRAEHFEQPVRLNVDAIAAVRLAESTAETSRRFEVIDGDRVGPAPKRTVRRQPYLRSIQ